MSKQLLRVHRSSTILSECTTANLLLIITRRERTPRTLPHQLIRSNYTSLTTACDVCTMEIRRRVEVKAYAQSENLLQRLSGKSNLNLWQVSQLHPCEKVFTLNSYKLTVLAHSVKYQMTSGESSQYTLAVTGGTSHTVNLTVNTCSCSFRRTWLMPCRHTFNVLLSLHIPILKKEWCLRDGWGHTKVMACLTKLCPMY